MIVDVKLLAVLALPLAYFFALLQLAFWLRHRQRRVYLHWAMVNGVSALGATLLVARTVAPLWVTTSLANTVLVAALFMQWASMARFAGREPPLAIFGLVTAAFFIAFQSLWSITDDLGMRILLASMASAILNACVAYELLRGQQQLRLQTRAFLASVFALHALFYLFRAATAVTLDGDRDFLQANGIQNLTVMVAAIKLIAWNTGALLMVREHARKAG